MKFIFTLHRITKKPKNILFLDRDGVVIKDTGYPHEKEKVFFEITQIKKIVDLLEDQKFDCCGFVTNQSGVGKGIFTEKDFWSFHNMIINKCNELDLNIDFTAVNFFQNEEYYRKPNNGMLEQALNFFDCKSNKCLFIGDKATDANAAKKSNLPFRYIQELIKT